MTKAKAQGRSFEVWQQCAWEELLKTTKCPPEDILQHVDEIRKYAQLALLAATNLREQLLAMGSLMQAEAIRTLRVTGIAALDV